MWFEHLTYFTAVERPDLLAAPVAAAIHLIPEAMVFEIDPDFADTEAMCENYGLPIERSANIVLATGFRDGERRDVGCMTLAHRRVDMNNTVKRRLDVRKASFTPMAEAVAESGMEYGAITPVGLPWRVWVDGVVATTPWICVGSGLRTSKLILPGRTLLDLPNAELVEGLARDV